MNHAALSRLQHRHVLRVLRQGQVTLVEGDQKVCGFEWIDLCAHQAALLSPLQGHDDAPVPVGKDLRRPAPEALIKGRHLVRQIVERATAAHILGSQGRGLHNVDQRVNRIGSLLQRPQPLLARDERNHIIHDRVPQGLLARKMVVHGPFGHARLFQQRLKIRAAVARLVDLTERGLQQALARALRIAPRNTTWGLRRGRT